jgi:hypothetical protein
VWLDDLLKSGRSAHVVQLTPAARSLVCEVLLEAMTDRLAEPPARHFFRGQARTVTPECVGAALDRSNAAAILAALLTDAADSSRHVTLIGLLGAIHRNWCNIWPFCRPDPDPAPTLMTPATTSTT